MEPLLCGAAEVDITPNLSLPMAGYSLDGNEAVGVMGHLFARALYIEDANGERVAFCVVDLHSGTRYLLEKASRKTGPICGITVDRLLLSGTHTHTAPGNIYGNTFYDRFSQKRSGLDKDLADWLASRIALAVEQAADRKEPALIGFAERTLLGVSRNRSMKPFLNNLDPDAWNQPGAPGEGCPADLPETRCKVDPRISVLAAFRESDRWPLGVLAYFGCHTTTLGMKADYYAPDWAGYACRAARWALEGAEPEREVVIGVGLSGAGDVNALRHGLTPPWRQSPSLARSVGSRVGAQIAKAARAARSSASHATVSALYAEPTTKSGAAYPKPRARLAKEWMIGASTIAGSEDGRSDLFKLGLAREGMTDKGTPVPQRPKAQAAGPLHDILKFFLGLDPGSVLPLHAFRVGDHVFVTVPGEPTAHAAYDIERAVQKETGASRVTVIGFAGDYFGYFPTPREYDLQHYEGASAIFGRNSTPHVSARLTDLVKAGQSGPLQPRPVRFRGPTRRSRFEPPEELSCTRVDPKPEVTRKASRVHVWWEMDWEDRVPLALEWFVRVEFKKDGKWSPLQSMGRAFDDVYSFIHVEREGTQLEGGRTRWHATFVLPPRSDAHGSLAVRVNERGGFQGFRAEIPPRS